MRIPCPNAPFCRGGLIQGQGDVHPCPVCAEPCTQCPLAEAWVESAYELALVEWRIRARTWMAERGLGIESARRVGVEMLLATKYPRTPTRPCCTVCHGRGLVGDGTVEAS
jgi:hypothetical protein